MWSTPYVFKDVLGETPRTAGGTPALPGTKNLYPQVQLQFGVGIS